MKKWMEQFLAIALLISIASLAKGQANPYNPKLMNLWAEASQLNNQGDYAGAQKVYEGALQEAQQLTDSLVKRCAIAFSRVGLAGMVTVQKYLREHDHNPERTDGIETTLIQQNYATWAEVGQELQLRSTDCP